MTCPKCQFQNPEGEFVCQQCRAVLAVPTPPVVPPAPTAGVEPAAAAGPAPSPEIQAPTLLKKWLWIWAGAAGLILILGAVVAILAIRSKPGSAGKTIPTASTGLPATASPTTLPVINSGSDSDGVPNDVEAAIGTNPNYQECSELLTNPCGLITASVSGSETVKNVLIILDSSGSMAEKISGKTKMDIAKSVLSDYLNDLFKKGYKVGLMVYGHEGSNLIKDKAVSCAGIEIVLPIGSGTDKINSALTQFFPTGWTPIASSLGEAGKLLLSYSPAENTVLLISDGEETCGGNSIDAAKKLKESGINAVVNVIGFGVDTKTRSQLQSIASAGGGKFFFSSDEESLRKAAEDVQTGIANARSGSDAQICVAQEKHKLLVCLNDFYYTKAGKYMKDPASQKTFSEKYKEIETKFDEIVAPFIQNSRNQLQEGVLQIQQGREDKSAQ